MIAELTSAPQWSLGLIVMGISATCAALALLRGAFRLVVGTVLLALSLGVAYWVWMETPGWWDRIWQQPPAYVPFILPLLGGVATFLLLRKVLRVVLNPFGTIGGRPVSPMGKLFSLTLSVVPTALLCLTAAIAIRHVGTLQQVADPATQHTSALWKTVIDRYIPPAWMQRFDPLTDPSRLTLAQLISMASDEHIPRAIPVSDQEALEQGVLSDPTLQKFSQEKRYGDLLRDPALEQALRDPRVQQVLKELRLAKP
jgi:hypothetical protein